MIIKLELTEDEAVALHQIIDAAVRSLGLNAAAACHVINQKLIAATKAAGAANGKAPPPENAEKAVPVPKAAKH